MDRSLFRKQLMIISGLIIFFLIFDLLIYNTVTIRYIDKRGSEMKRYSVEVSEYLPFREDSGIVHLKADETMQGDLPVLDGAAALFPVFSSFADALYPADSVSYDGKDFANASALTFHNTMGAYKALVDGDADVIFCAEPSREQLDYADEHDAELVMVPIGYEAFVFIVGRDNPVQDLTIDQVQGLYTGRYTNWKEVGGDDRLVDAVQRNPGSGSQTAMLGFMNGQKMHRSLPGALTGRAIGYSFRYYVEGLSVNEDVRMLSLNGVYPSAGNIADGLYPISGPFYAVYLKGNDNENIPRLLDFVLSPRGQEIIRQSGYVPLDARAE